MIRRAEPSEIEKIITITRACAAHMEAQGIYQWNEHYPSLAAFKEDVARNQLYVLVRANELVGSIVISTLKDAVYEGVSWLTADGGQRYIHRLAVHPDFQRMGYARRLMDFAETLSSDEGAISVRLDTFSLNKRNQKFYEARGYRRLDAIYFPKQSDHPFYCYEKLL
jgi:ribosomal protein S18 acetylase RimI-like enzyme